MAFWWDLKETLSYNRLVNFVVGNRGGGKTYAAKTWCLKDAIENHKQFIWVRRYVTEFDTLKTTFFNDLPNDFIQEDQELEITETKSGYIFWFKEAEDKPKRILGYGVPLSTSNKKKSVSYAQVDKIIFDEFIVDNGGTSTYLKHEVQIFLDLMETVIRLRSDFRCCFFLANAISEYNPYFLYFGLETPTGKKKIRAYKNDVLVQFVANEEYIKAKKQSRFGKFVEGTQYAEYSIENKFLRDSSAFVCKPPEDIHPHFNLTTEQGVYGVWFSSKERVYFVTHKHDPSLQHNYATVLEDHSPNTQLLKGTSKTPLFKMFIQAFKQGGVFFDSIKTKNIIQDIIRRTL